MVKNLNSNLQTVDDIRITIDAKLELVFHISFLVYVRVEVDCTFYVNHCSHIALQQTTVFILLF